MRIIDRLSSLGTYAAGFAALAMMLQVVVDVLAKYFLGSGIETTEEVVSYYYMIAVVVLPLATVEIKNEHVSVDVLYDRFPAGMRLFCDRLARLLTLVLFAALGYQSTLQAIESYRVGELSMGAASIVIWPTRFVLPIGFFLVALVALAKLVQKRSDAAPPAPSTTEPV